MKKIIIIGSTSYLQSGFDIKLDEYNIKHIHYSTIDNNQDILRQADYIINFGIDNIFNLKKLEPYQIIDCYIADIIKDTNVHQIFISSRKIYGSSKDIKMYNENSPRLPSDIYSYNKIVAEDYLLNTLSDKCLILRVSNIIGEPIYRESYKTFIGWMCKEYVNKGKLNIDINVNSVKDFITKEFFQKSIKLCMDKNITGVYNLSAGFGITIKEILENYVGVSNLIFMGQNKEVNDQFILDNSRLTNLLQINFDKDELINMMHLYKEQLEELKSRING